MTREQTNVKACFQRTSFFDKFNLMGKEGHKYPKDDKQKSN